MSGETLILYRNLLRAAAKFSSYNFRNYAFRRIRDDFVANKAVSDPEKLKELLTNSRNQLDILRRQGTISQMYASPELVVEKI